jgi:predicted AAA+ superfamily ATPase
MMSEPLLPPDLTHALSALIAQARRALPQVPAEPDFSALAHTWQHQSLQPIHQPRPIHLSDLIGIDRQKRDIVQNTRQFLAGLPANDVLLTGARGTGKSSIVRALLTDFADQGLRLIEVARDDLADLPKIRQLIADQSERFIIYCDDLAFNAEDENYRALKSVLDGAIASGDQNVLIYATSNRRHLLPEYEHENQPILQHNPNGSVELRPQEVIDEKVSLSDRFGLWLSFHPMNQDLYLEIVAHWLGQSGLSLDDDARREAIKWVMTRSQRSGRSAAQFARHWVGLKGLAAHDQHTQQDATS